MYREKSICIVIPAYNEEKLIGKVIETMPDFVDRIVVVDDRSRDHTVE
ncbi:glycosyltransferase, partial [candidate division WOR-3 bacterium]|nr:glycosyltransferase [candidate division WOR-3 bacterium]